MRYLLAIGGLLLAGAAIFGLWLFLPKSTAAPGADTAAQAAQTAQVAQADTGKSLEAENDGAGSLRVCNQTANAVSIALGYRAERGWQSEGWWVAQPDECKTVFSGDLSARRYYYIYAADDAGGGSWDGSFYMCTRDESFTIFDENDCLARGYERTGFFEVDTHYKASWMLQLTDNQVQGAESETGTDAPLDGMDATDGGAAIDEGAGADGQPADGPDAEGAVEE